MRTIRKYTSQPIPEQLLRDMIYQASWAPTTGNMQLYSVVATRDAENKKKLAPAHFGQPQVESCDTVLTICADFNRFDKWCLARNAQPGYDNLQALTWAILDATIFAQKFVEIAAQNGIGCCYLGTTTYNARQIADLLDLPERVVPIVTLTVGYPADAGEDVGRLPLEAILHSEQYHDYAPADIDRLYAEKEARADSQEFARVNGKENLAQVFTDVRYPKAVNEEFSKLFAQFISSQFPGILSGDCD